MWAGSLRCTRRIFRVIIGLYIYLHNDDDDDDDDQDSFRRSPRRNLSFFFIAHHASA